MFSETLNMNILSAHELSWSERNDESDVRPYHAISFRILGNARFIHKKGITKAVTGDIVYVPPYCPYTLECESEHLFVIHFETNEVPGNDIINFTPQNPSYYQSKFEEFYTAWSKKQPGYIYECKSIFYKILMHIEREKLQTSSHGSEDRLNEAADFIHDNFTTSEFSIEQLAKLCDMSGTYFRKLFMKKYQMSPLEYINKLKTQYATELLKSNYYTISEVSEKCGFKNIYYFSSFIKRETGLSPSIIARKSDL